MNWTSAAEFFHMGGYWPYVWPSYAAAALLMLAEPLLAHRRHRQALQAAARDHLSSNDEADR